MNRSSDAYAEMLILTLERKIEADEEIVVQARQAIRDLCAFHADAQGVLEEYAEIKAKEQALRESQQS